MMEWLESFAKAIGDSTLPVFISIAKVASAGIGTAFLSQQSVEWFYSPTAEATRFKFLQDPAIKRRVAMLVGMSVSMAGHYAEWPFSFGDGPKGWVLAVLAGFLGGGAASALRDWGKDKWFVPTRTNGNGK